MHRLISLLALALLVGGCLHEDRATRLQDSIDTTPTSTPGTATSFYPRFDPGNGVLPYPNDLLFSGSSDGTLNIPVDPDASDAAVKTALNALDGFSTLAPISVGFSSTVDETTLAAGVRVFEVSLSGIGGAVTGITAELSPGSDYLASLSTLDENQTTLVITPLKPLKPATSYLVVLTKALKDSNGIPASAELPYAIAKNTSPLVDDDGNSLLGALDDSEAAAFEPVRQWVNAAETALTAYDSTLARDDIVLSWSFTTQSVGQVLEAVRNKVQSDPVPSSSLADTGADSPLGAADIYAGTVALPYYLEAPSEENPTAPLSSHWQASNGGEVTALNPSPQARSTQQVPLLVSIPKTGSAPWPVVIYQHGITTNRATLLAVADTLAQAGFAAVAIDLPLHGLTGDETDGTQAFYMPGKERTFDLDLLDNATNAPGPDGITDASGSHFINLASLLTARDNLRQAVADLFGLTRALADMDYDGDGNGDFDTGNVRFLGHSLGAMVGTVFLALEPGVGAATLAMPGGGIAKLLDGSARFGPVIAAGLAANGVNKGSPEYEAFLASAQTVLDSADPINYAGDTTNGRGIHLLEVANDQVIPNNVLNIADTVPSPTAGTDPLIAAMGLDKLTQSSSGSTPLTGWVLFSAGHHGSLLTPDDANGEADPTSASVMAEMQQQLAGFLASNGTSLNIGNTSVVNTSAP